MNLSPIPETSNLSQESDALLHDIMVFEINNDDDFEFAQRLVKAASDHIGKIESKVKPHVSAAYDHHKSLVAFLKELCAPAVKAKAIINDKIAIYDQAKRDARKAEEAKLLAKGVLPPAKQEVKVEGVALARRWRFKIVNEAAIPEEFIIRTVNTSAIQKIVDRLKDKTNIPGIEPYEHTEVRS